MVSAPDQVITLVYDTDRSPGFRRGFKVGLTAVAGVVVAGSLAGLLSVLPVKSADAQRPAGQRAVAARADRVAPATPAAAWGWPMFDFKEPKYSGRSGSRVEP